MKGGRDEIDGMECKQSYCGLAIGSMQALLFENTRWAKNAALSRRAIAICGNVALKRDNACLLFGS